MVNKNKAIVFFGILFILINIMSVNAEIVYQIQYDGDNIDYGVITKSFDLVIVKRFVLDKKR